jgi:uncharacterized protein (DUF433 family)
MADQKSVIHSDPEIMGGTPVFVGTRVPLRNLIDYLEGGYSLDEFSTTFRRCRESRRWRCSKTPTTR